MGVKLKISSTPERDKPVSTVTQMKSNCLTSPLIGSWSDLVMSTISYMPEVSAYTWLTLRVASEIRHFIIVSNFFYNCNTVDSLLFGHLGTGL